MNRIVWVMGQSAAGKAMFIEEAVQNPDSELMREIGFGNGKIIPIHESAVLGDDERHKLIDLVLPILEHETNAVILIKWQHPDTGNDIIGKLKNATPSASNEILCLTVESGVLYERLKKKPWWNEADGFTQENQDHVVEIMRDNIKNYLRRGLYLTAEIDATDGYKLIDNSMLI